MKRVITYGTYDLLHYGHINLLRRAKELGDYLIVALSTDEFNWNEKQKKCYFTYEQRKQLLESIRYVDLVIPETCWEQKKTDVHEYHVDTFVIGDDWEGKFDFLRDEGCEVVYLPRTPEISSTQIKTDLKRNVKRSGNTKSNNQLDKIHELEIMIAKEIRRICEKYDIRYFLTAGSALGAVRHKGFIPWDDDMDIGMMRKDYNKFLKVCAKELRGGYYLQTWYTDPEYPFSYAKVRLKGTHIVEEFSAGSAMNDGIFVDIFPYDAVPDKAAARKLQSIRYFMCKRLLWIKKGMGKNMKNGKIKALKYYLFLAFSHLFKYESIRAYFEKTQTRYNGKHTKKIVTDGSYGYSKESIERSWAEDLAMVKFEDTEFPTYREKEKYLSCFYGDYMKLPPVDQRGGHSRLKVDFGPYTD